MLKKIKCFLIGIITGISACILRKLYYNWRTTSEAGADTEDSRGTITDTQSTVESLQYSNTEFKQILDKIRKTKQDT